MNIIKNNLLFSGVLVAIAVVAVFFFLSRQSDKETSIAISSDSFDQCFEYRQETISTDGVSIVNREFVGLSLEGVQVSGIHLIEPHGQDSSRASLLGVTDQGLVNAIASVSVADSSWQEQRLYQVSEDRLFVGYEREPQNRVKKDAVYYYSDINNIAFETSEFFLESIPCN